MEKWTGSKLGKEYVKAVYCHSAYLTCMQSKSCEMPSWMNYKLKSRFLGEISIWYFSGDSKITAVGDCSHEIKRCLLLGRKVMSNLSSVQLLSRVQLFVTPWTAGHQAPPSMGFSRQEYHFPGKGCHHLLLDSILKSKDITLPTKVHLVKAMVFHLSCMHVRVEL